ncbi:MAG TPA: hypothetical protein VE398_25750 [Acidobacteriota bacterium]|nr:hypothetical protein [Acidobacteriota bacterium]
MCWFSAHKNLSTRNAIEGEELVVQQFSDPNRRWLASPGEPSVAVCLPSGCNMRLSEIPENLQNLLHVEPEAVVEFRETYQPPQPLLHRIFPAQTIHDVVVFTHGGHFSVGMLPIGMRIDVLSTKERARVRERLEDWEAETVSVPRP